jgi:hypothetical protein
MSQKSKKNPTYYDRCVRVIFEDLSEKLGILVDMQRRIANGDSKEKYRTDPRGRIPTVKKKESVVI